MVECRGRMEWSFHECGKDAGITYNCIHLHLAVSLDLHGPRMSLGGWEMQWKGPHRCPEVTGKRESL